MLSQLWTEFADLSFPDRIPRDVGAGIDLKLLDAGAVACVEAFLMTGMLDDPDSTFSEPRTPSSRLLPQLRGDAAEYFRRLAQLCTLVLNRIDTRRSAV